VHLGILGVKIVMILATTASIQQGNFRTGEAVLHLGINIFVVPITNVELV
jgi:hypothetical protein